MFVQVPLAELSVVCCHTCDGCSGDLNARKESCFFHLLSRQLGIFISQRSSAVPGTSGRNSHLHSVALFLAFTVLIFYIRNSDNASYMSLPAIIQTPFDGYFQKQGEGLLITFYSILTFF